jgi:hypothetical protein
MEISGRGLFNVLLMGWDEENTTNLSIDNLWIMAPAWYLSSRSSGANQLTRHSVSNNTNVSPGITLTNVLYMIQRC